MEGNNILKKSAHLAAGKHKFSILPWLAVLLLAALMAWPTAPALADQVEVFSAIEAFRKAQAEGSEYGMQQATKKLFQNFDGWESWAKSKSADPNLAKAIDEKMVDMTKEVWSEIATKSGGVDRVVPVGSMSSRGKPDSKYIIGKSDKDLIPMGPRAKESVKEFNEAFTRKFGVEPQKAKINILDPTDPSSWKGRVEAIENIEKYNTIGGNKWLKSDLYKKNNNVWSLGPDGALSEVPYRKAVSAPETLTKADAAGFFSDNTRFRSHFAELPANDRMLMQSKYDLRNMEAYRLSGGKITAQERALMDAAEKASKGNVDEAIEAFGKSVGKQGDDAAKAYLAAMDEFTTKIGKKVFTEHINLLKKTPSALMTREMAGAINNLPLDMAEKIGKEVGESSAYSRVLWNKADDMADEILKHPGIRSQIDDMFNTRARNAYGKAYDALSDSERAALHGSFEEASSWGGKLGIGLAAVGAAWALYDAVNTGYKEGGLTTAAGYGFGRLVLEAAQYGYPPLVFAELTARAAAFGIEYKMNQFKEGTLDELYKLYKSNPNATNLSDIIQYDSATGKFAGGLREFSKELRAQAAKEGKTLTNADIDKALKDYLTRRYNNEQLAKAVDRFKNQAKAWISKNGVSLIPGGSEFDTQRLEENDPDAYHRLILNLMLKHHQIMAQLKKDGILDAESNAWYLLKVLYNSGPEAYQKALSRLYATYDKVYPPPNGEGCPEKCRTRIEKVRGTSRELAKMPRHSMQSIAKAGVIAAIGGGFQEHGVDEACDPAIKRGPYTLATGGKIEAEIAGSPPVKQKWSLGNRNTGLQVWYEPKLPRGGFGPGQRLINISGDIKTGKARQAADVPGPGRLTLVALPPSGNGPLSGSCFGQSFTGKVTLTEVSKAMPAARGMDIDNGDTLKTGPNGRILIDISCRGKILVENNAEVQLDKDGRSFKVLKGTVQIKSRKGCKAPAVEAGGKIVVVPHGTEYRVEVGKDDQVKVKVMSGSVTVEDTQNPQSAKEVYAGYELDVKTGQEKEMTPPRNGEGEYDGLNLEQLMEVDDSDPEPYGEHPLKYYGRRFHGGWIWQDPKDDVKVSAIDGGIKVDVPGGNDFWHHRSGAPRLMHRVTGDFDLDLNLLMLCEGNHLAITEFFIYAPGSHLGYLNKQANLDNAGVDHLLMGGGWQRMQNANRLLFWGRKFQDSPDAPDKPVMLRLSRRGHWFYSLWSDNGGKTWQLSGRQRLQVAETIYTGLLFKRMVNDGKRQAMAESTIKDMTLVNKPAGSMDLPRWVRQEVFGQIEIKGDGGRFIHAKEHMAFNRLMLARPLDGDFNAVAQVDLGSGEPGEGGVIAGMEIIAVDEEEQAYVKLVNHRKHGKRYATGMSGQRDEWPYKAPAKAWLRLSRIGNTVSAYYWLEGKWVLMKSYEKSFPGEVHLFLVSQTDWNTHTPMATEVVIDLEYLALGADAKTAYEPKGYELLAKLTPPALQLPQGVSANLYQTPFPMMNPFFDSAGNLYLLPAEKKKQAMIMLPPTGPAVRFRESEAFTGKNWKRGALAGQPPAGHRGRLAPGRQPALRPLRGGRPGQGNRGWRQAGQGRRSFGPDTGAGWFAGHRRLRVQPALARGPGRQRDPALRQGKTDLRL